MKNIHKSVIIMGCTLVFLNLSSCSKLVEVDPPITNLNGENVYNENGSAIAVLTGIYTNMSNAPIGTTTGWLTNIVFTTGLTGDELKLKMVDNGAYLAYYENSISPMETTWQNIYKMIFIANSAIERLPQASALTPGVKNQLLGEALFIRALCNFYLVNLYGDIPLAISTDYTINRLLARTDVNQVYEQIITDLKAAHNVLNANYVGKDCVTSTIERVRPNKWTATALLARTYLYLGRFADAEQQATTLIEGNTLYKLAEINDVFLKNNSEAIWQLQSLGFQANKAANTEEGKLFKLSVLPNSDSYTVYLNKELVESFDQNDMRRHVWISSVTSGGEVYYFPYKYKLGVEDAQTQEYSTVFRLGEQYLIRAEARIRSGKVAEGIADLNRIRARATNSEPAAPKLNQLQLDLSTANALMALEEERRHELFAEWGHRWFDLKRTNRINAVLSASKSNWSSTDQLFPLPQADVVQNPNLIGHQNPGYN